MNRCTSCQGIWFDEYEQKTLKALKGSESIDTGDPQVGEEYNQVDKIDCPVCNVPMTRLVDAKQSHIWYEGCPVCYGVFFDAGEFQDYKAETILDFLKGFTVIERQ